MSHISLMFVLALVVSCGRGGVHSGGAERAGVTPKANAATPETNAAMAETNAVTGHKLEYSMQDDTVGRLVRAAMDTMRSKEFFMETYIASDHGLVESILASKQEVRALVEKCPAVCDAIVREIDADADVKDRALIPLMITLRLAGHRPAVAGVIGYIQRAIDSAASEPANLWAMNHPFIYAAHTLDALTHGEIPRELFEDPVAHRDGLLIAARSWLERNPQ